MVISSSQQDTSDRVELWNSLVAELRSKLSTMETASQVRKGEIDEPLDNEFYMTFGDDLISVWLNVEFGEGSWNAITKILDRAEPWFLSPQGVFQIDGETMNLAAAADRFIAKASCQWPAVT